MAQAVSRRPPTAEARFRSRVSPCGICGGQSGTATVFSPSTLVFPCQFHLEEDKNNSNLHLKHRVAQEAVRSCGASLASAVGPFSTKEYCLTMVKIKFTLDRP
jgi:hypothetical protein